MKYAILGSNCFSAQDLIRQLAEDKNNEILSISRGHDRSGYSRMRFYGVESAAKIKYHGIDLVRAMPKALTVMDEFKPDYVINFTALSEIANSWAHPSDYIRACTITTSDLVSHFSKTKYLKRFVQIGTPEIYGACDGAKEDQRIAPTTPYAAAKACADHLVEMHGQQMPINIVRSSNVYGVGQQLYRIIPKSIIKMKLNEKIELRGGGYSIKSYINIRDVSRGIKLMLEKGKEGETYHFGSYHGYSVRSVVKMIANKLGKSFEKLTIDIPRTHERDKFYLLDSSKAKEQLGWKQEIELPQGLDEVIQWLERNIDHVISHNLEYRHVA